jgi:HrpA-like RNA helicase
MPFKKVAPFPWSVLRYINIYQPRRISAMSLAQRVGAEVGDHHLFGPKSWVGYQVKNDSKVNSNTCIQYVTTGILLRVLESDPELINTTHVVVDEVHERTLESDFLLLLLKRILVKRKGLKVILMSATADAQHFADYFDFHVPCLFIPGKTFPVQTWFLEEVIEKTGFRMFADSEYASPPSNLLAHVQKLSVSDKRGSKRSLNFSWNEELEHVDDSIKGTLERMNHDRINYDLIAALVKYICQYSEDNGSILIFLPGIYEIKRAYDTIHEELEIGSRDGYKLWVLQLHGGLEAKEQSLVFQTSARGFRKVVLSTNVAETGITIPDVVYVVDTCRAREIGFDLKRGISRLSDVLISKANAKQRQGRAGRVQEGQCFRLITKERFENLPNHRPPEAHRVPLQDICLRFRSIIKETNVLFQLLQLLIDPPPAKTIEIAVSLLKSIHALDDQEMITNEGRLLAQLPLDVQIGNIVLYGILFGCLDPILTICSILSTGKTMFSIKEKFGAKSHKLIEKESDILSWVNVYNHWQEMHFEKRTKAEIFTFCRSYNLVTSDLELIHETRLQLLDSLYKAKFLQSKIKITSYPRPLSLDAKLDRFSKNKTIISAAFACGTFGHLVAKTKQEGMKLGSLYLCKNPNTTVKVHATSFCESPSFSTQYWYSYYQVQMKKSGSGYQAVLYDLSKIPSMVYPIVANVVEYQPIQQRFSLDSGQIYIKCKPRSAASLLSLRTSFMLAKSLLLKGNVDAASKEIQKTIHVLSML